MNSIRLKTLIKKEVHRFLKVWTQTVFSPVVIAILYFAVFGAALSSRIDTFSGIPYLAFIVPGLAMLQSTTNAFQNPASSIIISKYHGTIADLQLAPFSPLEKTIAFFVGGVVRGFLVAALTFFVASFFVPNFFPQHPFFLLLSFALANGIFSLLGTFVGLWGSSFDQVSGFASFLLVPMGFLGGVFYSVTILPPFAQQLSYLNPFFYFVDSARWAFFGVSDFSPFLSFSLLGSLFVLLFLLVFWAFFTDWKVKS